MEKIILLTGDEAEYFINQIQRRGKAGSCPAGRPHRYRKTYSGVTDHLKKNFMGYLVYYITGGKNNFSEPALMAAINTFEKRGLFESLKAAMREGNAQAFTFYCWKLKTAYRDVLQAEIQKQREFNDTALRAG